MNKINYKKLSQEDDLILIHEYEKGQTRVIKPQKGNLFWVTSKVVLSLLLVIGLIEILIYIGKIGTLFILLIAMWILSKLDHKNNPSKGKIIQDELKRRKII